MSLALAGGSLPLVPSGKMKQTNKEGQIPVQGVGKGNPLTLLVGMQTSTATMENSVEIPEKTGNRPAL